MEVDLIKLEGQLRAIQADADAKLVELGKLKVTKEAAERNLGAVAESLKENLGTGIDKDAFLKFFKKPYAVISQGRHKALVVVPKFVTDFQVGWLWKETDTHTIFQLDQHSAWLGDVPQDLLQELELKRDVQAVVDGNQVLFDPDQKEAVKRRLKGHVTDVGENAARVVRGHEFQVLVELIEGGCLPFKPRPVAKADRRDGQVKFTLRPYQVPVIKKFEDTGAVGVFHPTGAGKSMIALWAMDMLKGKKLIIVPTRTLVDQWWYYIETHAPHLKAEVTISTYQGHRVTDYDEYVITVFDEAHRLPADTFSRLATIRTKYRLGLSASPHREDGRESYIYSLTGFPMGLNWRTYMDEVGRKYHPVFVHVAKTRTGKLAKLRKILNPKKRTLIFCDGIELGKQVANELNVPFIYGDTKDRLTELQSSKVCVVSRVMDLGVSIKDLEHVIEIDFLMGSRQQELQRSGRLMHSEEEGRHDILFTEAEYHSYSKRLWALTEKGFSVKVVSDVE